MEAKISKIKYLTLSSLLCLVLIFNQQNWQILILGIITGTFYLLFVSQITGSIFFNKGGWSTIFGSILLTTIIAFLGGLLIYFYQFNNYVFYLVLVLLPAVLFIPYYQIEIREKFSLKKIIKKYLDQFDGRREPKSNSALVISYLVLISFGFWLLFLSQTTESIQSPWQVVPPKIFSLYFFASLILLVFLFRSHRTKLPLILIIIHTFFSTSVAAIIYRIGYGFDPFIHQATEKIIAQTGTISPKPLYYLGQYALIIFLNKLTLINFEFLDRWLVPVLYSLFLPLTIFYVFSHWLKKNYVLVLTALPLAIPYAGFIMTAPQNLANLFFILTIFLSLLYFRNQLSPIVLHLLTIATIAIHPLAGIPLLITIFLLQLFKILYKSYHRHLSLYVLAALVFTLFIPLALVVNGEALKLSSIGVKLSDFKIFGWVNHFDLPLDLAYLFLTNKILMAGLIIGVGLYYLAKHKLLRNNAAYLTATAIIFINYLIVKYFLVFSALRDNDKNAFISRLLTIVFYILLPIFFVGGYYLIKKFWTKNLVAKTFLILFLAGTFTISFYLSYPRLNQYEPAKFFNVSTSDLKAVNLIEQISAPEHIVLANQMIGAAAIKEFGFKKYYDNQFYYSMPMGPKQTLYDLYLEMIYQGAKKETMAKAMAEAQVNEAYFVLNQYWNNSEKIRQQAVKTADKIFNIDEGKIFIFKYSKN
ncbi:MAG: hypothetical protein A2729_04715 [Candidatus Buchananbacteria bacterium RIFCSPHIGHO2_01_FULL_39_14]|uniref:Glycosyltransferase RgtA/B/C/D-like domain-containing protein n=1 Tax=Candidatus Buchananbacteria bacterium RIFCSPHIGHO2_01_FULL_39_14 TaxID=1797532 RepID=A0A1G1XTR7_9BACT|nr:MAG: hypothetical protein A2729_04715 [Candidatus Buchananbacteria bacterium RIFCSPHIGHO2_01_FULL_39_14]